MTIDINDLTAPGLLLLGEIHPEYGGALFCNTDELCWTVYKHPELIGLINKNYPDRPSHFQHAVIHGYMRGQHYNDWGQRDYIQILTSAVEIKFGEQYPLLASDTISILSRMTPDDFQQKGAAGQAAIDRLRLTPERICEVANHMAPNMLSHYAAVSLEMLKDPRQQQVVKAMHRMIERGDTVGLQQIVEASQNTL